MAKIRKSQRKLKDIIASKRWSKLCPRCMSDMDYIELAGTMKSWSPHSHGWTCPGCVGRPVYVLDGDIDPEAKSWQRKRRELERKELFATVGAIGFKKERTRELKCSRALDGQLQPQSAGSEVEDHLSDDTSSS